MSETKDIITNRSIKSASAALEAHTESMGIDTRDHKGKHSNSIAIYHCLHSLWDLTEREGHNFEGLVREVKNDRQQ